MIQLKNLPKSYLSRLQGIVCDYYELELREPIPDYIWTYDMRELLAHMTELHCTCLVKFGPDIPWSFPDIPWQSPKQSD